MLQTSRGYRLDAQKNLLVIMKGCDDQTKLQPCQNKKKIAITDQEALKHYSGNEAIIGAIDPNTKEKLKGSQASNPAVIKPDISIDATMTKRKSKTMNVPPAVPKKKKH